MPGLRPVLRGKTRLYAVGSMLSCRHMSNTDDAGRFRLNAILGGVQKAGTTTFFRYLQAHPELAAPSRKETHFFDNEAIDWRNPDYGRLEAFFPKKSGEQLAFDATPIYLFWPLALERIRAHNPDARLIFIFRDPIERAWSHWCMETHRDAEDLPFASAIREGRKRLVGEQRHDQAWRTCSYVERGFYARQSRRLLNLFPREQILFLSFAELINEPRTVLRRVAPFLGISAFPSMPAYHERRSDSPQMRREDVYYLREMFRDEVAEFSKLSALNVDSWLTMRHD